jgi:hypothetical protein
MSRAIQIRDASDVTTFKKQKAIYNNYVHLQDKSTLPIGGISHNDLMAVARHAATFIPANSLKATVSTTSTDPERKLNTVSYSVTQIISQNCLANLSGGSCWGAEGYPYQKELFVAQFR